MTATRIEEYEVVYPSNALAPRVRLKNGGRYIGELVFEPAERVLPADTAQCLYYRLDALPTILELLRNEASLYLVFAENGVDNGLETRVGSAGKESVGPLGGGPTTDFRTLAREERAAVRDIGELDY